jgi:hypothetical protein
VSTVPQMNVDELVVVDQLKRSPSGKADLRWAQQIATEPAAAPSP